MHIAFVAASFPTPMRPTAGTFVRQFVRAMATQSHSCTVIHPVSVFERRLGKLPQRVSHEKVGTHQIEVLRQPYLSCSSRNLKITHTGRWTQKTFDRAVLSSIRSMEKKPDIVYGHFLYIAGRAAVVAGTTLGIPSVIGVGEGTFWTVEPYGMEKARRDLSEASGFIAVATHIRNGLKTQFDVPEEKILLAPNGVDLDKFRPMDRTNARKALGIDENLFLVVFVGNFDQLKGCRELVQAVDGLEGVGLAMIGSGPMEFQSNQLIHRGPVSHDRLPIWLNAADSFVLPTREEGSCNAVIEAMACGLPIVTSDGNYMDDLVNDNVAVRVTPTDSTAIRQAIKALQIDPELRMTMSRACLERSKLFDINLRAKKIASWMNEIVQREASLSK